MSVQGSGRGSVFKQGPLGTMAKREAESEISRLKSGLLPGEVASGDNRSTVQVLAAAKMHPADHVGAGS